MSLSMEAFLGAPASTVQIAATTATANVAITGLEGGGSVRFYNSGSVGVRVAFGKTNAVTATTPAGSTPGSKMIPAGAVEILKALPGTTYVAAKTDTGTATIEMTPGLGL